MSMLVATWVLADATAILALSGPVAPLAWFNGPGDPTMKAAVGTGR